MTEANANPRTPGAGRSSTAAGTPRASAPIEVWLPGLGSVHMSRAELAYVGGIVGLSALGFLDWPLALVVAAGHVLAADRSSTAVADLGQAMEQA